ncbi:hypothetical protein ACFQY0_20510 [Haloferula chungangensis]|uniref:PEP-CTERM sorting domain-containing protein n=1 Tax=Haloferula chungangensis TaxID=1048331 RepID=A0ABW2LAU2_9BACT
MIEVPPARIPEEPGAVIPHAGICEGPLGKRGPYLDRVKNPMPVPALFMLLIICAVFEASGATLVIDEFDDGDFSLSSIGEGREDKDIQDGSMLGGDRYTKISSASSHFATTASVSVGAPGLRFSAPSGGTEPLMTRAWFFAAWSFPQRVDLSGENGFVLFLESVAGHAAVEIELRGGFNQSVILAGAITDPGSLFVSLDASGIEPSLITDIGSVYLTITSSSPSFSTTIDSFKIVPEPGLSALMFWSVAFTLAGRKRR